MKLSSSEHISSVIQSYLKELDYRYQNQNNFLGLSTGINSLDKKLGGLRKGEVILLAARPAMGKTAFAINLSYKIAKSFLEEQKNKSDNNKCVLYFSLEFPKLRWLQRLFSSKLKLTDIPAYKFYNFEYGSASYNEFAEIATIGKGLEELPIYICDEIFSLKNIEEKINEIHQHNVSFIVIDYLQLIPDNEPPQSILCTTLMKFIKEIAKKYDVPILVLSQLNNSPEKRDDHRPMLSDLREYGNIIPYADKILFLYRESYYLELNKPQKYLKETKENFQKRINEWIKRCKEIKDKCEIWIAKNKYGNCCCTICFFDKTTGNFKDWEQLDNKRAEF